MDTRIGGEWQESADNVDEDILIEDEDSEIDREGMQTTDDKNKDFVSH